MNNIPPRIFKQIQEAILRPEGSFVFEYQSPDLFDKAKPGGTILEIPSGQHLFRLERDNDFFMHFYHSSPGTGTRVATIDLKKVPAVSQVFIAFSWAPKEIALHVGPRPGAELLSATGIASNKQFRVGRDGHVYQIGDHGVETMGISIYQGGKPIILPTALEAWRETVRAIDILSKGESAAGYQYEVVVTNLTLVFLVTGFEAYSKKRFLELEEEGITPNTDAIVEAFYPPKEQDVGLKERLKATAMDAQVSVLRYVVDRNVINFQIFKKCKLAYNKGYGIRFGELGLSGNKIEDLQSYIKYRHKIIHVSPSLGMLNQERVPPEEPVFPKKETAEKARGCFEEFIERLHQATLELRPKT